MNKESQVRYRRTYFQPNDKSKANAIERNALVYLVILVSCVCDIQTQKRQQYKLFEKLKNGPHQIYKKKNTSRHRR